jgi:predicted acyl esterase
MLFLTREKDAGSHFRLSTKRPRSSYLLQEVDFADRKTSNNDYYPFPILDKKPDLTNGFTFVSAPFEKPLEIGGFFTGKLRAVINKRDMDFGLVLYEMMSDGTLMELSYFTGRASYAQDISARHLLTPGNVATIAFDRSRLVSRRLKKGSRLLLTLNVNKNAFAQINYGTGKNVSDEDIRDAGTPLTVKWLTSSYIQIPISR